MDDFDIKKLESINPIQSKELVPKKKGIYFWIDHKTDDIVYIGVGAGVNGLYNRIVKQHLNPKYIEYRSEKHSIKDFFQLSCPVKKVVKGEMKNGIDQSAFRKNIGRSFKIEPGEGTVGYILNNLYLKILPIEDIQLLKRTEKELIQNYQPKFNVAHR